MKNVLPVMKVCLLTLDYNNTQILTLIIIIIKFQNIKHPHI